MAKGKSSRENLRGIFIVPIITIAAVVLALVGSAAHAQDCDSTAVRSITGTEVSIAATPETCNGITGYVVQDALPAGLTAVNINSPGQWDSFRKMVKWAFLDNQPRTLTYTVTGPGGSYTYTSPSSLISLNSLNTLMTGDTVLIIPPTLTYAADANGSITGTSPQTVDYGADGATVTATPNAHYHFANWSDGPLGSGSTQNPRTDTNVTADISVTANFAIDTLTLTYAADANGSITGTSPQTVGYGGDGVAVTAAPATGYHFAQWSDLSTQNPRTDTKATEDISVTADFAINTYTLAYVAGANGSMTGTSPQTVDYGTAGVAVTAAPNAHYHFVNWSDASIQNPRADTNVTADISVTANFAIDTFTLTYAAGANGSILGASPQTVNYGTAGATVTAAPNAHYHFVNWSDASTENPRQDTNVGANINVTANFAITTHALTYTAGSNGSILGSSSQTVNDGANGTAVSAAANAHYHFVNWSDSSTQNPRTDTNVTADISMTANFAINTYTLTYAAGANGSITGTSPQTINYGANGTAVTAAPNTGYHFVQWNDASTQNPRADTNVTANISVTASFAINTYSLRYAAGANGSITGTTSQTVNYGASGTAVTAVPSTGYHFVKWSDNVLTATRRDTNVTANVSVGATFAINTYTLTYTAGANGTVSGASPQTVNYNTSGTAVTAAPSTHYHFVNWTDASTQNPRTDTNVTANVSVTANFAIDTFTLTYTAGAGGAITGTDPQTVNYGGSGTAVTAVPNTGYHFVQWSDNVLTAARTDANITANASFGATFAINTYTLTYDAGANGTVSGASPQTVNYGASGAAVTAVPSAHYHFVNWSDASTQNPRADINVTADISVTANFAIDTFALTYTAGPNGSISGASPQTVNYGADGAAVTAVANTHYHFLNWSDASTQNPRADISVTANINVTANFAIDTFTLTYAAAVNGSIAGTSPQTVNYGTDGAAVTAAPDAHYHFVNWSDASTQNPRTDTNVSANISVTANFAIDTFTLTYTEGVNGSIVGTSPQTINYSTDGATVTAAANAHYHFVNWSDASTQNPRTDTNVTANISLTANFAIDTFTLTYAAGANGLITGTSPQTVNYGADGAAVTAVANTHYHFVNWNDASTQNPRTDTNVTANINVTANFAINMYTLTYAAGTNGAITGASPQTVNYGANGAVVTAAANAHYHFVNWSDASTQNPRTDTNVTANINVTANFAINTYSLTYTAGANGSIIGISPQTVNYAASGTAVTATPNTGYHFVSWSDGSAVNPRTDTNVTANISVTANFVRCFVLTYTAGANGSISGTSLQTVNYGTSGTAVTATPNAHYHFAQWSDASTQNPRTDANVTAAISVTANFAINTYTLAYTTDANSSISGTASQTVNYGASGTTVTAVPKAGYQFAQWSDGVLTAARTDTNVTANISVTASAAPLRRYVNVNSTAPTPDGSSWTMAFASIQPAVNAATTGGGGEVWVAQGRYTSSTDPVVTMKANVAIYGGFAGTETARPQRDWTAHVTTIDGQGARRCVVGASPATLDGFVVTNGYVDTASGLGGGLYNNGTSPTVANCTFTNGAAYRGGGIYNETGSAPTITNCLFNANSAPGAAGGAVFNRITGAVVLRNCSFTGNSSPYGGAIYNYQCSPTITGCVFSGNSATQMAGGMYNNNASPTVTNCVFQGNSCSGSVSALLNSAVSSPAIIDCTFTGNTAGWGGAIRNSGGSMTITDCIVWGNTGGEIYDDSGVTPTVTYCDVQGGYAGTGNINADPLFVNAAAGDVRLTNPSPCIDTGTAAGAPLVDIAGHVRPVDIPGLGTDGTGTGFDMGAYEADFPVVVSIARANASPTNASSVAFTVTFSEPVTGVNASDFTLTASGVSGASISGVSADAGATRTVTASTGTGDGTIRLDVIDNDSIIDAASYLLGGVGAGNGNFTTGATYTIDKTGPTGSVVINGGAAWTTSTNVTLALTFSDDAGSGVVSMQFSNDGTTWTDWEAVASSRAWTLSAGDGPKTVYVQFEDAVGNPSTAPISGGITLDTTPPTGTITINGGALYTTSTSVTLGVSASDGSGSGVASMQFSNDNATWSGWEAIAASKAWTLLSGEGIKTVYAQVEDAAGNVSVGMIDAGITLVTVKVLTYTAGANGSISGASPQTVNYGTDGAAVTAVPNTHYRFLNWSDGPLGSGTTQNPRVDTNVTANISVTANFTGNSTAVRTITGASVSIEVTPDNSNVTGYVVQEPLPAGLAATAISSAGAWDSKNNMVKWVFMGDNNPRTLAYTVTGPGGLYAYSGDGVISVGGINAPITGDTALTIPFTLTYTAGSNGSIVGTSPQTVDYGGAGTAVTAAPNTGCAFVQWSDSSTQNPRTDANVTANITVTANFVIITATLSLTQSVNGALTAVEPPPYSVGTVVHLIATPDPGSVVQAWTGADTEPSTDTTNTVTMTTDKTVSVTFVRLFPCDTDPIPGNKIWDIEANELSSYVAAWLAGKGWPIAPANIPANYVSRAVALWLNGEKYTNNGGGEPMCWAAPAK